MYLCCSNQYLLTWQDSPRAGWYDAEGEFVDESEVYGRYRDEVVARCGIREFVDDGLIATVADEEVAVYLDRDIVLMVPDEADIKSPVLRRYARIASSTAKGAVTEM